MYKILIVDDEKMIRQGIEKSIPWQSILIQEVYTAASAKEAMEVIERHHPDVMITDISMTEMTGLELVEHIRREATDMRIIVLTGYDKFEYARQALQLQVHDFLLKPIDEKELTNSIQGQIEELVKLRVSRENTMTVKRTQGLQQQLKLEKYLRKLLGNDVIEEYQEEEFFQQFHFDKRQHLTVGILIPDRQEKEDKEMELFRIQTIKQICINILDEQNAGITFSDEKNRIILIFFEKAGEIWGKKSAKEITEVLGYEYNVRPKLIMGSKTEGFSKLSISYNDAIFRLEQERENCCSLKEADRKREDIFQDVFNEFKRTMIGNIDNPESIMHAFERFQMSVESYNLSNEYARNTCFDLASSVYFACVNENGNKLEENLNSLTHSLGGTDRENACVVTAMFLQKLLFREDGDEHELIWKVKKRIHGNLADDLTVTNIASELYVTPNYLSRLFKRITGEGCNEYIVRNRIEKAKSLLETTTLKAGEIATMVGYHDMNYFSLAFKKHTGISPTKYRDTVQKKYL